MKSTPLYRADSAARGQQQAQRAGRSEDWDRRILLAAHGIGQFRPDDLGPPTTKLVEALHRLVEADYIARVALPACQWVYEETPLGWLEAERVLAGGSYRKRKVGFKRRWHGHVPAER